MYSLYAIASSVIVHISRLPEMCARMEIEEEPRIVSNQMEWAFAYFYLNCLWRHTRDRHTKRVPKSSMKVITNVKYQPALAARNTLNGCSNSKYVIILYHAHAARGSIRFVQCLMMLIPTQKSHVNLITWATCVDLSWRLPYKQTTHINNVVNSCSSWNHVWVSIKNTDI